VPSYEVIITTTALSQPYRTIVDGVPDEKAASELALGRGIACGAFPPDAHPKSAHVIPLVAVLLWTDG